MKSLSFSALFELNRLDSDVPWLMALKVHLKDPRTNQVVEQLRLVRNDEPVFIDGEEYTPFPFEIEITESTGELPTVSVSVRDPTKVIQSKMQTYGGGVGSDVELYIVMAKDAKNIVSEPELHEFLVITNAGASDYVVSWDLGAENPLAQLFPLRRQSKDQCSFRYKSLDCGYSGGLKSCDLSLNGENGCVRHNNEENFGGFPGISNR